MNKGKKFSDFKLVSFLDRIDLFMSLLWILWALILVYSSIFIDYNHFIIDIPDIVAYVSLGFVVILTLVIKNYCSKDSADSKRKKIFLGWNAVFPLIYNIILLILMDKLYDFSGVFLGGFTSQLMRIINIVLSIVFIIIYYVRIHIRNRASQKGKVINTDRLRPVKSVLNIFVFAAGCIALIILAITWTVEGIDYQKTQKYITSTSLFKEEMNNKIPESENPYNEAWLAVLTVEMMSEGQTFDIDSENGNAFRCTSVSQKVFDKAATDYKNFISENTLDSSFSNKETDNCTVLYCYDDRTVHYCFSVNGKDSDGNFIRATIDCKYDENWNLVKIYAKPYVIDKNNRE